jgi:hypothetical protein
MYDAMRFEWKAAKKQWKMTEATSRDGSARMSARGISGVQ